MQMRAIHSITPRFHGGFVDGRRGCVIHCVHCVQGNERTLVLGKGGGDTEKKRERIFSGIF